MNGKTVASFIDELYNNPEIEAKFRDMHFMVSGYLDSDNIYTLRVDTIEVRSQELFAVASKDRESCVSAFENARIFHGMSIYEAENEIEVLYG